MRTRTGVGSEQDLDPKLRPEPEPTPEAKPEKKQYRNNKQNSLNNITTLKFKNRHQYQNKTHNQNRNKNRTQTPSRTKTESEFRIESWLCSHKNDNHNTQQQVRNVNGIPNPTLETETTPNKNREDEATGHKQ